MVTQEEDKEFLMEADKEEILVVLKSFKKDRSPGLDGWAMEFFLTFFDLKRGDLLKMVIKVKGRGKILSA